MEDVTYDNEADILYVRLRRGVSARQGFLGNDRIIDYSEEDDVLGVEFIDASHGIELEDLADASHIEKLIKAAGGQFKIFA